MGNIKLLTEATINKIAAGEVVERPASVIKELIENSIDAGAKNIAVETEAGGKKRICVRDDGCGMGEADIFMSLERHATSKLTDISDLNTLLTMGFRGEAIPSIAAVTNFSIASAQEHGSGFKISTKNGSVARNMAVSMAKGTEITADDLFFNIPVRKKFLKTDEYEYAKTKEMILSFAVIHPEIAFSYTNNSRSSLTFPAAAAHRERISAVWKLPKDLIGAGEALREKVSAKAFVPSPTESTPALSVLSVNGRIVADRTVRSAIFRTMKEAIGGEFKSGVMVFIESDPQFVDVNVHPSKLEVRFQDPFIVTEVIREAILNAYQSLRNAGEKEIAEQENIENTCETSIKSRFDEKEPETKNETPLFDAANAADDGLIHGKISAKPAFEAPFAEREYVSERTNFGLRDKCSVPTYSGRGINPHNEQAYIPVNDAPVSDLFGMKLKDYKKIGTVFGVYLILEMDDRIVFLDQHAAHERITFDGLKKALAVKSGLSQTLLAPVLIQLSAAEAEALRENSAKFSDAGFVIELFDESSALLRATPALGFETDWEKTVKEMLGELAEYCDTFELQDIFLSHLAQRACKASVRRNDVLADEEIDALIDAVNRSDFISCPHGRPFFFTMSKNEFEKKVQRR